MSKHLPAPKNKHVKPSMEKFSEAADAAERLTRRRKMPETEFSLPAALPVLAALAVFFLALRLKAEGTVGLLSFLLPAVLAGAPVLLRILSAALRGEFTEGDILIILAAAGAFCLGEYPAAAAAVILYRVAELLEAFLTAHASAALDQLRDRLPEKGGVETADGLDVVPAGEIVPGDLLVVMPGETVAADGIVEDGISALDCSFLTGKSDALPVAPGSRVLSGSVNQTQMLKLRVERPAEESAAARLVELVEIAHSNRSGKERFMSRFTTVYTPIVACAALLIGLIPPLFNQMWAEQLRRALVFLLLASPCGLVAFTPLTYFGGVVSAARRGSFLKGSKFIETLSRAQIAVFEKTGVITEREYEIMEAFPEDGDEQELLDLAAKAETLSEHPIAKAFRAAGGASASEIMEVETKPCRGVSAFADGKHLCVGNAGLMMEHHVRCAVPDRKGIDIHVAADNEYMGYFLLNNKVREGAFDALESIRSRGVKNMVMLTGDLHAVARQVAASLSFDMVKTELDQAGKLAAVEYLLASRGDRASLIFVGDGVQDAELFRRADAGVALGAMEAPQALDEADVLVMGEDIRSLAELMRICRQTELSARLSILVSLSVRLGGLVLGALGVLPLMWAVLLEAGAAVWAGAGAFAALRPGPED